MPIAELHPPDLHRLRAAIGWLELGNPTEAGEEIARVSAEALENPNVLAVRWQICAASQSWEAGRDVAERQVAVAPERVDGWIHRSYAIRRAKDGGLAKAREALLPAATLFPKEPLVPYNLACYASRSGQLDEAWDWLHKAVQAGGNKAAVQTLALADEDLQPLWDRMDEL